MGKRGTEMQEGKLRMDGDGEMTDRRGKERKKGNKQNRKMVGDSGREEKVEMRLERQKETMTNYRETVQLGKLNLIKGKEKKSREQKRKQSSLDR